MNNIIPLGAMGKYAGLLFLLWPSVMQASTVTGFTGFYRGGQVFFTWNNTNDNKPIYKLYRSTGPITDGTQLSNCEFLGITNESSSKNYNLSAADGTNRYWVIEPNGSPLPSSKGLFVTTSVMDGYFYYALTVSVNGVEDKTIIPGSNSLLTPIYETVQEPEPLLLETRIIGGHAVDIYGDFLTSQFEAYGPLQMKAGWLGYCFAVFKNNATQPVPLYVFFHAGGSDFLDKITEVKGNEIRLNVEDYFPSNENSGWVGTHPSYDPFKKKNNTVVPTSGYNYFYSLRRIRRTIDFVIRHYPVDTTCISLEGSSFGSNGALFFALTYPEMIASVRVTGGIFNFGFQNDYQPNCTMNTGMKNRLDGDKKLGTAATNLMEWYFQQPTYDLLNACLQVHRRRETDWPVIFSINGKRDDLIGWTEKIAWYDSVNANAVGGYYFFDMRKHSGEGKTWHQLPFDAFRYRTNVSYPAFSNCSANEDPGEGDDQTGDTVGTINGYLDWTDPLADNASSWIIKIFMRDLPTVNGSRIAPDSCTVDLTPRRRQGFHPSPGTLILWEVSHHGQLVQRDTLHYTGGLITFRGVKIFKDTVLFSATLLPPITGSRYYQDADGDGFGNVFSWIISPHMPDGYVADSTDCDDTQALIHPDATEVCNGIDDNCNVETDEGVLSRYYADFDGDMFGDLWVHVAACTAPSGYVSDSSDCNDSNASIHPLAEETCNGMDDNCNGLVDEGILSATITPEGTVQACDGVTVTLTANAGSGLTYQWFKDGVALAGKTKQTLKVAGSNAGNYQVRIQISAGCSSFSPITTVQRVAKPKASIKVEGNLDICATGSVTLKAKDGSGTQWQWYRNDELITGATLQTYVATTAGQYKVKVTEPILGCSKTSSAVTVYSSCRTGELTEHLHITLFPQPADEFLEVKMPVLDKPWLLEIRNLAGQVVLQKSAVGWQRLDVSHLPAGKYLLLCRSHLNVMFAPLVIQ
ncbi:MAG: MopE-related protein [Chitinophagales bacterium]|nr:MopE-related protein [Chitinophagales bacterium]MDW8427602.1 MopE-related protein [Chitinophagales bacterium]